MKVRQITSGDVSGLDYIHGDVIGQLKYDGTLHHLHIKNYKAYALTSKRVSVKTGLLSEKLDNFPLLKKYKFPFKKETIVVVETAAEHLDYVPPNKRVNYVAGICNSKADKVQDNELRFYAHSFLYLEGKYVGDCINSEQIKMIKKYFPSAGKYGEKVSLKDRHVVYGIESLTIQEIAGVNADRCTIEKLQKIVNKKSFKFEGYVFKELHSLNMLKIKKIRTSDCIIIGYTEPTPNTKYSLNDWIGAIKVGVLNKAYPYKTNYLCKREVDELLAQNKIIDVGAVSGITEEIRSEISLNKDDHIGEIIEVAYMQWTGSRMFQPRFKRFRDDKQVGKCTIKQF